MDEIQPAKYRVYRMRWIQLWIYFFATCVNGMTTTTYVPIVRQTSIFFHITTTQVNLLAVLFMFLYVVGASMYMYCTRLLPLRWTMIIASLLQIGTLIRLVALLDPEHGYSALVVGQILPALAAPFFLNSTAFFAALWFPVSQRDVATAIGSMANPIGSAIGSLLPSLLVSDKPTSEQFFKLLCIEGGLVLVSSLLVLVLFRSEPPSPPSATEEHHFTIHFKADLIHLLTNRHYMILATGFCLGLGLINAITSVLFQLVEPFGYNSKDAGIFGTLILLSGLFNAFIAGLIMDRTHAYRRTLKLLLVGAAASIIFFLFMLRPNQYYALAVSMGLMGFFLLPLLPVCFECAVECTYPIRPEWSTGLFMFVGSTLGGLFTFMLGYLIPFDPLLHSPIILTPASLFIFAVFTTSAITLFLFNGPYLRYDADRQATCQ